MGISGLLPFVKKASRPCFLREFGGSVAAVDTYCWLHKGAFSCAEKLVRGEDTDGYVVYVMKMVRLLLSHRIKPIMVFDGCNLPSKAGTEAKRRESRAKNRALAKELLREGRTREARECFQRCVDVTSHMARAVMTACRQINVDVIVAPYEADAQLAYLAQAGFADLIITEDSDLILFGCEKVVFKLDSSGGGVLVEQEKLHLAMGIPAHKFNLETFRHMCVLSGCDYLASLPGIGLAKACKFFTLTSNTDVFNALCKLPSYLKMPSLEVPLEYREGFRRAVFTFLHQLVFCPRDRLLRPLTEPDDGSEPSDHPYAGAFIGHERAMQIALGNIDVQTGQQVDHFDPDRHQAPAMKSSGWCSSGDKVAEYSSIWQPDYDRNAFRERCVADRRAATGGGKARGEGLSAFVVNDTRKRDMGEKGRHVAPDKGTMNKSKDMKSTNQHGEVKKVMDIKSLFAKRKREIDQEASDDMSDLLALYRCPTKTAKTEAPDVKPSPARLQSQRPLPSQGEASATQNLFAKYRCSPSNNPFAKKKLDGDNRLKIEKLSRVKVDGGIDPIVIEDDENQEPLLNSSNYPSNKLKCDADFKREDDTNSLLEDDPCISDADTGKGRENIGTSGDSFVAAEEKETAVSNSLADKNLLASLRGRNIVLKSKYFRPAGITPIPALKRDNPELISNASDGRHCTTTTTEERIVDDNTSDPTLDSLHSSIGHATLSTNCSEQDEEGATTNDSDDEHKLSKMNDSTATGRRGSLLSSSALSRRFSSQSSKLDPASSSCGKQGRVSSPTPNSEDDPNVCGVDEETPRPSSPILSRRTSFKTRTRKTQSISLEQSTKAGCSSGSVPENDIDSRVFSSEDGRNSQASVEGPSFNKLESSQRSCRLDLLDDSCDKESFGLTPLQSQNTADEGNDHLTDIDEDDQGPESQEQSHTHKESQRINLIESQSPSSSGDIDSDVAMHSSIEEESPYQASSKQSQNMAANESTRSSGEEIELMEVCDGLPAEVLGTTVSPALVKQQRDILKALENTEKQNKNLQNSSHSSPYFSKMPANAVKPGACRRPGLAKPPKGGRQLNLRDMFSLKK